MKASDPDLIATRVDLAGVYLAARQTPLAKQQYEQAALVIETTSGSDAPELVRPLTGLGQINLLEGNPAAERIFLRVIAITEQHFGKDNAQLVGPLEGLSALYRRQGRQTQAEAAESRAKKIRKKTIGKARVMP